MNYGSIKKTDIANGIGVRVSLFVSGCTHHCKECFIPQTWDFGYGDPYTEETQREVMDALAPDFITGLSLLGGEPMEPDNQRALLPLIRAFKSAYPQKDLWIYSGYTFDTDLAEGGKAHCEATDEILSMTDILVDGEFMIDLKNISLRFRGSENQRIIRAKESKKAGVVILADEFM